MIVEVSQPGGQTRAEQAGSENPHRHLQACAGNGLNRLTGLDRLEVVQQFLHILRERFRTIVIPTQRAHGGLIGTWRAA